MEILYINIRPELHVLTLCLKNLQCVCVHLSGRETALDVILVETDAFSPRCQLCQTFLLFCGKVCLKWCRLIQNSSTLWPEWQEHSISLNEGLDSRTWSLGLFQVSGLLIRCTLTTFIHHFLNPDYNFLSFVISCKPSDWVIVLL